MKVNHTYRLACLLALILTACSQPRPPTLTEAASSFATPTTKRGWAELGWWHYLAEKIEAARGAFQKSGDDPLGRLGRLQLAEDSLDRQGIQQLSRSLSKRDDEIGVIARRWLIDGMSNTSRPHKPFSTDCVHALLKTSTPLALLTMLSGSQPKRIGNDLIIAGISYPGKPGVKSQEKSSGVTVVLCPQTKQKRISELSIFGPALIWTHKESSFVRPARKTVRLVRHPQSLDNPLIMAWAGDRAPQMSILQPTPPIKWAQKGPKVANRSSGPNWVHQYVIVKAALARMNLDRAWTYLQASPATAAFQTLRADLWARMDGTSPQEKIDAQIPALEDARRIAPVRSAVRLSSLLRNRGRGDDALEVIERALKLEPDKPEVRGEWIRCLVAADRKEQALKSLSAARSIQTERCALFDSERRLYATEPAHRDVLVERITECGNPIDAVQLLRRWHRPQDALALLDRIKLNGPSARLEKVKALLALGKLKEARAAIGKPEGFDLGRLAIDFEQADDTNRDQSAQIRDLVRQYITQNEAIELLTSRPEWSPLGDLYRRSESVIDRFEASGKVNETTRVLDHSILRFTPQGKGLRRVHEIIAIRSRDAAEEFGELALPQDAQPILIYTRKANGNIRFASWSSDKETISLPDLVRGDYVVAIYIELAENHALNRGGFLSERAFLRDIGLPIFRGFFDVVMSPKHPVQFERRNGAPTPQWSKTPQSHRASFHFADTTPATAEPRGPSPSVWLPSIRVGSAINFREGLGLIQEQILAQRVANARFKSWVRNRVKGKHTNGLVEGLLSVVRAAYPHRDGLTAYSVNRGPSDGHGHRALAMSAGLEVLGIPHQLVLASPPHPNRFRQFEQINDYHVPLIRLTDGRFIFPGPDRGAMDYLPFGLLKGRAVVVWPPTEADVRIDLPAERMTEDKRRISVEAKWTADGQMIGQVDDVLSGNDAVVIGNYLASLESAEQVRLVEKLLVRAISSGHVTHLDPIDLSRTSSTLRLRYRFKAQVGNSIQLGVFPMSPGVTYAALAKRHSPLMMPVPVDQKVTIQIHGEGPWSLPTSPVHRVYKKNEFKMTAKADDNRIVIQSKLRINGGVTPPEDYPGFAQWARDVDKGERLKILRQKSNASRLSSSAPVALRPVHQLDSPSRQ